MSDTYRERAGHASKFIDEYLVPEVQLGTVTTPSQIIDLQVKYQEENPGQGNDFALSTVWNFVWQRVKLSEVKKKQRSETGEKASELDIQLFNSILDLLDEIEDLGE
jgi:hypothetical protein